MNEMTFQEKQEQKIQLQNEEAKGLEPLYLKRIAKNTKIIANILIFWLICGLVTGFIYFVKLFNVITL